jgi:hypothetical protein
MAAFRKTCLTLLALALAGCGSSGPPYKRAWGEVLYEGQPLDGGSIQGRRMPHWGGVNA